MSPLRSRSEPLMGTIVTIALVINADSAGDGAAVMSSDTGDAVDRAFAWFRHVEARCSRFDPASELSGVSSAPVKTPVPVSDLVFEALRFALQVAEMSDGAFDPVVGAAMAARGFNRHYATGDVIATAGQHGEATFRDVLLDPGARTVTLQTPLVLDLGAVAKGLAIDLAAKELATVGNFSIDAGGDLYLGGKNDEGEDWSVGIRHPRKDRAVIEVLRVSDCAVCTSGDYERGRHLLNPSSGEPAAGLASATVIAPTAMLADAASTAAFVMGPVDGLAFCREIGVHAILFTPGLERHETSGARRQ